MIFLGVDSTVPMRLELVRQVVFLIAATATVILVASRRAARDRLVDALDEVAALAEQVESRDARLELDARRIRYRLLGVGRRHGIR